MIKGRSITLRAPKDRDLDFLYSIRNNQKLQMTLMALPRPNSKRNVREWISRRTDDPQGLFFIIATARSDRPIGFIQLTHIEFVHGFGHLGICVDERHQGRGRGAEALRLFENYASSIFRIRKFLVQILATNSQSIRFHASQNYRHVGVLYDHYFQNEAFQHAYIMEKQLARTPHAKSRKKKS